MNRLLKMISFIVVLVTVAATAGQAVAATLHGGARDEGALAELVCPGGY